MCTEEMFWGISIELFYLDHLLCNLSGLVNIQDNLGIPHHRIKCSAFTQAESREKKHKDKISLLCWRDSDEIFDKYRRSTLFEQIKKNIQPKSKCPPSH